MTTVKSVPDDYPQVVPYLIVDGADAAIEFYGRVLGATERLRLDGPDGRVGHAELMIGTSMIMLADEAPQIGAVCPTTVGGTPVTISVYMEDVDAVVGRAIEAGATLLRPVADQFYGDRTGQYLDPFGHRWSIATHGEEVSPEEMAARASALGES